MLNTYFSILKCITFFAFLAIITSGCEKSGTGSSSEPTELEGTWIGSEIGSTEDFSFTFSGTNLQGSSNNTGEWFKGNFSVNPAVNPKQLDYTISDCMASPYIGKTALCIYKIEYDTLSSHRKTNILT